MKTHTTLALLAIVAATMLGCASHYRNVLVSVVDSNSGLPVEGVTISALDPSNPRPKRATNREAPVVTDTNGLVVLKIDPDQPLYTIIEVTIVNSQYDEHFGYSGSHEDWTFRSEDFIPTEPDIVLKVTSRIDRQRVEAERQSKSRSDDETADKLRKQ